MPTDSLPDMLRMQRRKTTSSSPPKAFLLALFSVLTTFT
jgi:hypothetical protein